MKVYIGTSGWNYGHWRERFYPRGLRQSDWLGHLARHFNTTEINSSFYRIPKREYVERWASQVGGGFRFAFKLWRGITQYKKLVDCREELAAFFDVFEALPAAKRGPVLVQLPPSQGRDDQKLDRFLGELRQVTAPRRWKVAVEFRNRQWLCDQVYRLLERHRAAICLHDMAGRAPVAEPNDVPFVYVRRHGPGGRYRGCYSQEQLEQDAARIGQWTAAGRTVFVYFNNDVEGFAVENAQQLRSMVQ